MTAAAECGFEILPHPLYSPDMAPSDYMFPKLKSHFRSTQYGSNKGVTEVVNQYLGDQEIPKLLEYLILVINLKR